MRADQQRRVPIPAVGLHPGRRYRLNGDFFAAQTVESRDPTVLGLRVNNVGIARVNLRFKTVALLRHEPVGVHNAAVVDGARRSSQGEVVLRTAVYVIERSGVVHRHAVKLRDGQIRFVVPSSRVVPRLVQTTVAAHEKMSWILGVQPQRVVVYVFTGFANGFKRLAAVARYLRVRVHGIDGVYIVGRGKDLRIVVACRGVIAHFAPRGPAIHGSVEPAAFNGCIHHVWIDGGEAHSNSANFTAGKSVACFGPRFSSVAADVQPAFRSAG